jgi:hypothetical protein
MVISQTIDILTIYMPVLQYSHDKVMDISRSSLKRLGHYKAWSDATLPAASCNTQQQGKGLRTPAQQLAHCFAVLAAAQLQCRKDAAPTLLTY